MAAPDEQTARPLVDSEKLYPLLFELLADEVHMWKLVRDEKGAIVTWRLVDANPAALKAWGKTRDEVVGQTTNEIFTNTDAVSLFMPIVQKIFTEGAPFHWETFFAGTEQYLRMTSFPAGDFFITTGVDVTERRLAEMTLRENEAREAFLAGLAESLRPFTDPAAVLAASSQALGEYLGGASVWMVPIDDAGTAAGTAGTELPGTAALPAPDPNEDYATIVDAVRDGRTFVVRRAAIDPTDQAEGDAPEGPLSPAGIAAPILVHDRLAAMLCVRDEAARDWTGAEVRLVAEAAKRIWPELQRAQAEQALRANTERQAFLLHLSDRVRPVTDPATIEEIITGATMAFFHASRCFYSEITDDFVLTHRDAVRDNLPSVVGHYPLAALPLFQAVVAAGRPVVVYDAYTSDVLDEVLRQLCIELQIASLIGVPVIKGGRAVGLLCIAQHTPRTWTDGEVELAVEIAERTWTVVERGNAEEALRQINEELEERVTNRTAALQASNTRLALEAAERARAEAALRQSEAHLAEAQRLAQLGSWEWLAATDGVTWSRELYRMLEVDPGKPPPTLAEQVSLYTPESYEQMNTAVAHTMRTGDPYEVELECIQKDGSRRWLLSRGEAWYNEQEQRMGLRGTALDITARKLAEEALQQSNVYLEETLAALQETQAHMLHRERLAAVGQFSAGIAHDFNNSLTTILSFTHLLQQMADMPAAAQPALKMVADSGQQAAQVVQQLLDFSQKTIRRLQPLELAALLDEQMVFLTRLLPETIAVTLSTVPDDYIVTADVTQLRQLITNLALNARDAMPAGGALQLGLSHVETTGAATCAYCGEAITGSWLCLTVTDSGTGMDEEAQAHMFEPFYTTKEANQGTGLGLAQVAGIVRQHNGHLTVHSRPGRGTTFTIYLPPSAETAAVAPEAAPAQILPGGGQTVLVVEDNATVVAAVTAVLEQLQYRVLTAVNGRDALQVYAAHRAEIALVLSDMNMPDMDGEALFRALRAENPDLTMAIMSGYPLGDKGTALLEQGLVAWLKKPFSMAELSAVISRALAKDTGG